MGQMKPNELVSLKTMNHASIERSFKLVFVNYALRGLYLQGCKGCHSHQVFPFRRVEVG